MTPHWWKAKYDFQRPNWQAFGHILFVSAETRDDADTIARHEIAAREPGATLTHLDVRPASDAEHTRYVAQVEAYRRWLANAAAGIPNHRGDL